jgi:hypothetical protein
MLSIQLKTELGDEIELGSPARSARKRGATGSLIYSLATQEDHIAPAKSVLYGSQYFGGPVTG